MPEPRPSDATPPLAGIRVLDLTNVLAGPYCTYQLALLGAEVVKIEVPGRGDLARVLGADETLNGQGMGASFLAQNAGKKSVELDLKRPSDHDTFLELVRGADVLVENFRAGVLDRLGLGWERLREINPRLVLCAITGFGQAGPMSQAPAYDQVIQGLSGMMSITGTPETAPLRVGFPISDTLGGLVAAMSICGALAGRAATGRGAFIDVSMLEASLSAMGWVVSNYLIAGVTPTPMGDQNATAAPSGTFYAADGPLNIAANRQEQFETLCRVIDRPDLLYDHRFLDREDRKRNRDALNHEINLSIRRHPALDWEKVLSAAGVPAARILTVPQALALPQLAHRGFLSELPLSEAAGRTIHIAGNGTLVNGEPLRPKTSPPQLGEHNGELPALAARWRAAADYTAAAEEEVPA